MAFAGFTEETFAFYEGLLADNSKGYWTAHKADYERHVREPLARLCAQLEPEFGPAKIFRPYRDLRFSADKTPYKTHQGAYTGRGLYVQVDADGLMVAGGMYAPTPQQLRRYRAAVNDDATGKDLESIVDALSAAGLEISGDRLKTRPRGIAPEHPRLDLLRHRSLYAHEGWPADPWMATPEVIDRVRASWRRLLPLVQWGRDNLGDPAEDAR
jgi:uncharacterized protein (TIGR02453 family)